MFHTPAIIFFFSFYLYRGDGWDGFHDRRHQRCVTQSEIQRSHRDLPSPGTEDRGSTTTHSCSYAQMHTIDGALFFFFFFFLTIKNKHTPAVVFAGWRGVPCERQHDVAESEAEPDHQRNEQTLLHCCCLFVVLLLFLSWQDAAQRLHLPPPATAQRLL